MVVMAMPASVILADHQCRVEGRSVWDGSFDEYHLVLQVHSYLQGITAQTLLISGGEVDTTTQHTHTHAAYYRLSIQYTDTRRVTLLWFLTPLLTENGMSIPSPAELEVRMKILSDKVRGG